MLKNINDIFRPKSIFLSFHTCGLTPLEPNLTTLAWRAKNFWSNGVGVH